MTTAPEASGYYTADRIDYWLRRWQWLVVAAESPGTSRRDLGSGAPSKRSGGGRPDPLRYADLVADVERARIHALRLHSIHANAVDYRMQGYALDQVATTLHLRYQDLCDAYREATERMATYLTTGAAP